MWQDPGTRIAIARGGAEKLATLLLPLSAVRMVFSTHIGEKMNYGRLVAAAVAATIAFFIYGFVVHGWFIAGDYRPYPEGVYRAGEDAGSHMLVGLAGIFVAILVFVTIFARASQGRAGVAEGARLGLLFGVFMAGAFAAVNFGTINISAKLALEIAGSELVEWTMVGVVVGLIYRPASEKK
jgi:hypothetical protein